MWSIREVKQKGKQIFLSAYWKFVLVALVLGVVAGGIGSASSGISSSTSSLGNQIEIKDNKFSIGNVFDDDDEDGDIDEEDIFGDEGSNDESDFSFVPETGDIIIAGRSFNLHDPDVSAILAVIVGALIVVSIICCIIGIIGIALDIFIKNPIEYGCVKFARKSVDNDENLTTMFSGFKDGYMKVVKVMFFRDLFIFLWSLLFVIPGIVKSYAYRLVPYILSENPSLTKDEALKESNRLMMGNKWKAFVLDLSFIGWAILTALSFGAVGVFYAAPYKLGTNAALYEALKKEKGSNVCPTEF